MPTSKPASWAMVLALVAAAPGCVTMTSTAGNCSTDELPETDPCFGKGCCDSVHLDADGGVVPDEVAEAPDAGPTTLRICGACNG